MFKIADGRSHFWQWDVGRKLIVSDSNVTKVHFGNKGIDFLLGVNVKEEDGKRVADIPDILFQKAFDIRAYAYVGDEYTQKSATFEVKSRPKPPDYVFTPTEQITLEKLIEKVGDIEERTFPAGGKKGQVVKKNSEKDYDYSWGDDVEGSGGSDVSENIVIKIVEDYLKANPPKDGVSPKITVTALSNGHRVTIVDAYGTKFFDVLNGNDYVLTESDKEEIAENVLELIPDNREVAY